MISQAPSALLLPKGSSFVRLLSELGDRPFWASSPAPDTADYADGLEEVIADFNQQPPSLLEEWAQQHPLTAEQRFILEYNTSADRANVLRPLPIAATDRVLEVGCGCGPVSQYLWSRSRTLSLEASAARARAAAYRLAPHANPHGSSLVCADFHQLTGTADFDWVIFNGVLEYAAVYSGAQETSPYVVMLKKAAEFLKPGGRCVVTIENRLGLKYFAGAPEDHFGRPAVGLEGYRTLGRARPSIRTFSRPELARLFRAAGFGEAGFQFPFPDYKFTKVVVPDDPASWQFAADRLIDNSPAWRGPRAQHFDEPSVYRSLASEGLAGEFANSFLAVAAKPGATAGDVAKGRLHYFPLRRQPALGVGAVFSLEHGQVQRQPLAGGRFTAGPDLPDHAPGNPKAKFAPPELAVDRQSTSQAISSVPTLWEALRRHIGAASDSPADYEAQLSAAVHASQELYLDSLPLALTGSWDSFLAKLRAEFVRDGLSVAAAGALRFLESQQAFAAASLASLKFPPWSLWAPDWIMENLFPTTDGYGVSLFDVEYVDSAACLPTPALIYRQLRMLQIKTAHPALAPHWPWPASQLHFQTSIVDLPSPVAAWAAEALWGNLPPAEAHRHAWFWTKVTEIVECAMIGTVVAPFTRVYETAPWLNALSTELDHLATLDLGDNPILQSTVSRNPKADKPVESDLVIAKEQQIRQLSDEVKVLRTVCEDRKVALAGKEQEIHAKEKELLGAHAVATERLEVIQKLDLGLNQARQAQAGKSGQAGGGATALITEVSSLRMQLAEVRRQLQTKISHVGRLEREIGAQTDRPQTPSLPLRKWQQLKAGWLGHLAATSPHPLARLSQYAPRTCQLEIFPRPPLLREWPRICIATPSYQQAQFLERTMLSVLDQHYPNLAYGVQDGGSTDGSAVIITRHMARLAHAESAPDQGQSDAIRRGFARLYPTTLDIMGWLNSDDILMPGALHHIGAYFARHPEVDVVYGHRVIIDDQDREIGRWFLPRHHADTLKWFDLVPQETMFWRARCYQDIGGLDPSFQFALDWDLLLRFEQAGYTIRRLPWFLGCFRSHPEQKTSAKIQSVGEQEMQRLRLRTHEREVPPQEIHRHLTDEINRSALVAWLHRHRVRY